MKNTNIIKTICTLAAITLVLPLLLAALTSCASEKKIIGIVQFGSHESLNNCYDGIMEGLREAGINIDDYKIEYMNSNFDPNVSQTQCSRLVNERASVIIAIATPSAIAAANAAADSDTPVVYCAVTDSSVMANYKNTTGSSDIPNFEKHVIYAVLISRYPTRFF